MSPSAFSTAEFQQNQVSPRRTSTARDISCFLKAKPSCLLPCYTVGKWEVQLVAIALVPDRSFRQYCSYRCNALSHHCNAPASKREI